MEMAIYSQKGIRPKRGDSPLGVYILRDHYSWVKTIGDFLRKIIYKHRFIGKI
jgi:hypothetical protein